MASIPDLTKVPGATTGNANSEPGKISGQFHSTKGSIVESIGNAAGATSWQQAGQEERDAGNAELKAAQAQDSEEAKAGGSTEQKDAAVDGVKGNNSK